jgi:RNA polymerase sigma-70 factor (ECF subfamily)
MSSSAPTAPALEAAAAARSQSPEVRRARAAELFVQHGAAVFGYCFRAVHDRALAEDLMQQVFLEAYRDLSRFRGESSTRTWLLAIAGHRSVDALRRKARTAQRMQGEDAATDVEDPRAGPFERLERTQLLAALDDCLTSLPPDTRATVLMRFQTNLTYEQMAAQLGTTPFALQMRVSRAMPALLACLERKGWIDE